MNLAGMSLEKAAFEKEAITGLAQGIGKGWNLARNVVKAAPSATSSAAKAVDDAAPAAANTWSNLIGSGVGQAAGKAYNFGAATTGNTVGQLNKTLGRTMEGLGGFRHVSKLKDPVVRAQEAARLSPVRKRLFDASQRLAKSEQARSKAFNQYTRTGMMGKWAPTNLIASMPGAIASPSGAGIALGLGGVDKVNTGINQYKADKIMDTYRQYQDMPFLQRMGFAMAPGMGESQIAGMIDPSQYARLIQSGQLDPKALMPLVRSGKLNSDQLREIAKQLNS